MRMPDTDAAARKEFLRDAALIVLAGLLVCGPRLWAKSLWSPDEARYAEVVREMRATGDYLTPRVYGEPETSYPPLYYWLLALFSLLPGRVGPLAATLPSLAAAVGLSLLTYRIGTALWDRRSGLLAALILTSMAGFVGPAILCRADMTLAFFEAAAFLGFVAWYRNRESRPFPLGFYLALAAAILAKGLQAGVIVGGVVLAFLAARREHSLVRRLRLLPGLGLVLALTLPWFVWVRLKTGQDFLLGESLSGFAGTLVPGGHGRRPVLNYIGVVFVRAFPWILFLPPALLLLRREELASARERGGAFAFLVSWFLVVFVFYSLAASKRHYYVTALYPVLALAVGRLWGLGADARTLRIPLAALALLAVGSELYLDLSPGRIGSFEMAPFSGGFRILHVAAFGTAVAGLVLTVLGARERGILALLGGLLVLVHWGSIAYYEIPQAAADEAAGRRFVDTLRAAIRPGERIALFREDVPSVPLYLDRDCVVLRDAEAVRARRAAGEAFVVGVKEWRLPEVTAILGPAPVVFRETLPAGGAVLIFLRPGR
jgi:4-amino-4-deoxy-L-arabinose transferase-like glycosyltransferase